MRLNFLITELLKLIVLTWTLGFIVELLTSLFNFSSATKKYLQTICLVTVIAVLSSFYLGNVVFNNRSLFSFSGGISFEEITEKPEEKETPAEEPDKDLIQLESIQNHNLSKIEVPKEVLVDKLANRIYTVYYRDSVGRTRDFAQEKARAYAREMIKQAEKFSNVSPFLLMAIAEVEGNYVNRGRTWDYGDYSLGIYWLQTNTAQWLWEIAEIEAEYTTQKVIDPLEWGTYLAAYYLEWLISTRFNGDIRKAIVGYNAGPNIADNFNPDLEPNDYVIKVLGVKEVLKSKFLEYQTGQVEAD